MRIALLSFEFPPDTAYGGIASYMHETALMLAGSGHDVEVFCAGLSDRSDTIAPGVAVHTIGQLDKDRFADLLLPVFRTRHATRPFEVAECGEIYADGRGVRREFPDLPLLVKLHTPSFLTHRLSTVPPGFVEKLRFFLGSLRQGAPRWLRPDLSVLRARDEAERQLYHAADAVVSPSRDLIPLVEAEWGARPDGISVLPNPHSPSAELLALPPEGSDGSLLFLGRLELRKGVSDLIEALALLEQRGRPVRATFVGAPFPSPERGLKMDAWAAARLPLDSGRYTFTGNVPRPEIARHLAKASLVVLPSRWENFPYTCLEAMAAGRAVLGSAAGGMRDMITDGVDGFLVPPSNPSLLADRIADCLRQPGRLASIGEAARRRVLDAYAPSAILPAHLESYRRAIARAASRIRST